LDDLCNINLLTYVASNDVMIYVGVVC